MVGMRLGGIDPSILRELSGVYKPFVKAFKELVSNAFDADADAVRVVFADDNRPLRLSGFIWPNNTERLLRGTAYVIEEPTGRGHVVLFAEDPNFRAIFRSTTRLFFNSFLFQPTF